MAADSGAKEAPEVAAVRSSRQNMVMIGLVTALVAPQVKHLTGVELTPEDVGLLCGGALMVWHACVSTAEKLVNLLMLYYPPPARPKASEPRPANPTAAAPPPPGASP